MPSGALTSSTGTDAFRRICSASLPKDATGAADTVATNDATHATVAT